MRPQLIIVCGPTASGKSALAIKLAQKLDTEIISADSLAIYKDLDIGTAKPTKEELKLVKHHLVDVVDPTDKFSVSDYESLALPIVEDLLSRGKTPIICGGTGFYINSILYKLSYGATAENTAVRGKYLKLLIMIITICLLILVYTILGKDRTACQLLSIFQVTSLREQFKGSKG